ncbi:MAG: DUF6062 family protein [bacterium]
MKYELQTIPIWNAYNSGDDCPLCHLESNLEQDYQRFFLGNSVMAPDVRVEVNAKGFCRHHYRLLYRGENKLGLALLAQTRLEERRRTFTRVARQTGHAGHGGFAPLEWIRRLLRRVRGAAPGSPGRLSRAGHGTSSRADEVRRGGVPAGRADGLTNGHRTPLDRAAEEIEVGTETCLICDRLERSLANYAFSIVSLYKKNPEFEKTFREAYGFCFHHLPLMLRMAEMVLAAGELDRWTEDLVAAQERHLRTLGTELEELTSRYDYRSTEGVTPELRRVLPRALGTLGGSM